MSGSAAFASGAGITYHGRLMKSDGTPVTAASVQFKIQIRTPGGENCLMYEETHTLNLSNTAGVFSITINDGTATTPNTEPFTLSELFRNHGTFSFGTGKCSGGTTYAPNPTDGRKLVVSFNDGSGWETLPAQEINFVPMALESESLGGRTPLSFLRVEDSATSGNTTELTAANLTEFWNLINGTSAQYMKSSATNGASLPALSSSPGAASAGTIWYDSSTGKIKYYDGTNTQTVGTSGGSITGITVGDGLVDGDGNTGTTITTSGKIQLPNVGVADTYYKVTTDSKGRVTSGSTSLAETDLPNITTAGKVSGDAISDGTIGGSTDISTTGDIAADQISAHGLYLSNLEPKTISILPPTSITSNYTLTLPSGVGSNKQVLTTDGVNTLYWSDPGGTGDFMADGSVPMTGNIQLNGHYLSGDGGNEGVYVDASGNVGIGTTDPSTALHVNGQVNIGSDLPSYTGVFDFVVNSSMGGIILNRTGGLEPFVRLTTPTSNSGGQLRGLDSGGLRFTDRDSATEWMRIDDAGKVGIGVINPSSLLTVGGSVALKEVTAPSATANYGKLYVKSSDSKLYFMNDAGVETALGAGSSGTVTSVTGTSPIAVDNTDAANPVVSVGDASTSAKGVVQLASDDGTDTTAGHVVQASDPRLGAAAGKLADSLNDGQIFIGNSSNTATGVTPSGDVSISDTGVTKVLAVQGTSVDSTAPSDASQVLKYDGTSKYIAGYFGIEDLKSTSGLQQIPDSCSTSQTMTWSSATDTFGCSDIAIANTQISGLGTAATKDVGTGTGNVVQLDSSGKIPASLLPTGTSQWTTTGSDIYYDDGKVGIGTDTPDAQLSISANTASQTPNTGSNLHITGSDDSSNALTLDAFGDHFYDSPYLTLRKASGTAAAPTAINNNDIIGDLQTYGYTGSSWLVGGSVVVEADEDWTASAAGSRMKFAVNKDGTTTSLTMGTFTGVGLGLGVTTPTRLLDIAGPVHIKATAAPTSPAAGDVYIDSGDSNKLKWYDGSAWQDAGGSSGGSSLWSSGGSSSINYTSGNVGIGTATPSSSLEVNGDFSFSAGADRTISISNPSTTVNGDSLTIKAATAAGGCCGNGTGGQIVLGGGFYSGNGGSVQITGGESFNGYRGGNLLLDGGAGPTTVKHGNVILASAGGNVGIGTTTPASLLDVNGAITSRPNGTSSGQTGQIALQELAANGTNAVTLRAPDSLSADVTYTLPSADGTSGQVLSTDGSGVLSWADASSGSGTPAGSSGQIQFNNSGAFGASGNLNWNDTSSLLELGYTGGTGSISFGDAYSGISGTSLIGLDIEGASGVKINSTAGGLTLSSGGNVSISNTVVGDTFDLISAGGMTFTSNPGDFIFNTGKVGIGTTTPASLLDVNGAITSRPNGTSSGQTGQIALRELVANGTNAVTLRAPDSLAADVTYTLPSADGTSGQVLSTDGSGVLSWADASSGSGTPGGSNTQVQFNNSSAFGGSSKFTWNDSDAELHLGAAQGQGQLVFGGGANSISNPSGDDIQITSGSGVTISSGGDVDISSDTSSVKIGSLATFATGSGDGITFTAPDGSGKIFSFDHFGDVGIGTAQAITPLDVTGTITSRPGGTSTGQTGQIALRELAANGTNAVTLRAPDSLAADVTYTLPAADGTNGQVLSTNGSGSLSWANSSSGSGDFKSDGSVAMTGNLRLNGHYLSGDGGSEGIIVDSSGKVGIGTATPGQTLDVNGSIQATSYFYTSDRRLKENIHTVDGLSLVDQLRGVRFNWRKDGHADVGLIAQEVEKVIPELVQTNPATGYKAVKYANLVGPLVEATKQLHVMCKMSQDQIQELDERVNAHDRELANQKLLIDQQQREIASMKAQMDRLQKVNEGLRKDLDQIHQYLKMPVR